MTLTLITDARPEDFGTKLARGFEHLLARCLSNESGMSLAEETAALKACMAYYETTQQKPGEKEGQFNGHIGTAAKFAASGRGGGASRDGGTIDQDADAF